MLTKLTQSLWSCLQSKSTGIGSFNFFFFCLCEPLFLRVSESFSLTEESSDTRMSQVLWFPLNGAQIYFIPAKSFTLLSDWLRGVKQVSDRTGVDILTLSWLERNWPACVNVCVQPGGHFARQSKGRSASTLITVRDKRVRSGLAEVWTLW